MFELSKGLNAGFVVFVVLPVLFILGTVIVPYLVPEESRRRYLERMRHAQWVILIGAVVGLLTFILSTLSTTGGSIAWSVCMGILAAAFFDNKSEWRRRIREQKKYGKPKGVRT